MSSKDEKTSFKQFKYCSLCRLNHKNGKKHIYSKHHQIVLSNILKKFTAKIQMAKKNLFSPEVHDELFEKGAKFWCYFCVLEVSKHEIIEDCTVCGAGLLEHIAGADHKSNMEQFFWDNLLKKDKKPNFVLSAEDLNIFKKASFLAVKKRQKAQDTSRRQLAEEMKSMEERRHIRLVQAVQSECSVSSTSQLDISANRPGTSQDNLERTSLQSRPGTSHSHQIRRTISAKGEGLTCVSRTPASEEGNVHTGATPPWLQQDNTVYNRTEIGPTINDFNKHLEDEKKAKLPAERVGAKFDHKAATSEDWLPSFGRVWSKGRRLQSKQHFEKSWKKDKPSGSHKPTHTASMRETSGATFKNNNQNNRPWRTEQKFEHQGHKDSSHWPKGEFPSNETRPYKRKREETQSSYTRTNSMNNSVDNEHYSLSTSSTLSNKVTPYKRKHAGQNVNNEYANFSNSAINSIGNFDAAVSVPYKRQNRTGDEGGTTSLIQTPVLSLESHK